GYRTDHGRSHARNVTDGLHRARAEIPEQKPVTEKTDHHETDEREQGWMSCEQYGAEQRTQAQHTVTEQRGARQSSHAEAHDQLAVHERRDANRAGEQAKEDRKLATQTVLFLKHLLRHRQVADEAAKYEAAGQRVAERNPTPESLRAAASDRTQRKRHSPLLGQRLRLPQGEPKRVERGDYHQGSKDRAPTPDEQHRLAHGRREDRNQDEHRLHEGHDPRHTRPSVRVAHQGYRNDARPCGTEARERAAHEQPGKALRQRANDPTDHEEADAEVQCRLASGAVRDRPINELTERHASEEYAQNQLTIIGLRRAELARD